MLNYKKLLGYGIYESETLYRGNQTSIRKNRVKVSILYGSSRKIIFITEFEPASVVATSGHIIIISTLKHFTEEKISWPHNNKSTFTLMIFQNYT